MNIFWVVESGESGDLYLYIYICVCCCVVCTCIIQKRYRERVRKMLVKIESRMKAKEERNVRERVRREKGVGGTHKNPFKRYR